MATKTKVEYIGHFDIYDAKEALILSLEFALVKDLYGDYR